MSTWSALEVGMKPWHGRAGRARLAVPGKGGGASSVAWPRPRRVCRREEAQGTMPGTPARWTGIPHLPCPAP
jgi:hypothetical protein